MEPTRPPKDRILEAAAKLFQSESTHTVTLDRIVAEANTTKMAFYRHFEGREALVAEWLHAISVQSEGRWQWLAAEHPRDPIAQINGWTRFMASRISAKHGRGCPFMSTAAELSDPDHPAWKVIHEHRNHVTQRLGLLCKQAHLPHPERLVRQILYLVDGAQGNAFNLGATVVADDLVQMVSSLIEHRRPVRRPKQRQLSSQGARSRNYLASSLTK